MFTTTFVCCNSTEKVEGAFTLQCEAILLLQLTTVYLENVYLIRWIQKVSTFIYMKEPLKLTN